VIAGYGIVRSPLSGGGFRPTQPLSPVIQVRICFSFRLQNANQPQHREQVRGDERGEEEF
jgi:hypothetical protein